ncbi:MAG: imidazole glycerol phosphate synthase subunit HisH [Spirochaetales bacterium]|nr:imidazole glycerol phosphate synthase subunit HisH [Spirochaetales bacterium]
MSIAVVDYNAGNLRSVETALKHLRAEFFITSDPDKILKADKLIFPGVGEARAAMKVLHETNLDQAITDYYKSGRPFLGICLGSQIILDSSEESRTACLGLIPGVARRFPRQAGYKVPHMGWNQVLHNGSHYLFKGIPDAASFYFVHSYYPDPYEQKARITDTEYMIKFCSTLSVNNLTAVQFHPEKSGKYGLKLLQNFLAARGI